MTDRPGLAALANEFATIGPLHPAQARRCAQTALRRLEGFVSALEFYCDASGDELVADGGARARAALDPKGVASPGAPV